MGLVDRRPVFPSGVSGPEAGRSTVVLPPTLHRLASACRRPDVVRGLPLRAGAGLLACCGSCGSGRAADWGHAAYGSVYRGSGAPPWVPRPSWGGGGGSPSGPAGGCRAAVPLVVSACLCAGGGKRGRVGGGRGLPAVSLRFPGAALRWLRGGGLMVSAPGGQPLTGGGGALPSRSHTTHRVLGSRAGPHPRAPRSSRRCCLAAWHRPGGEGRAGGRWGLRFGSAVSG